MYKCQRWCGKSAERWACLCLHSINYITIFFTVNKMPEKLKSLNLNKNYLQNCIPNAYRSVLVSKTEETGQTSINNNKNNNNELNNIYLFYKLMTNFVLFSFTFFRCNI